jgi:hypothetical protein
MLMKFIALLPLVGAVTDVSSSKIEPNLADSGQKSTAEEKSVLDSNSRVIGERAADTAAVVSADGSVTIGESSRAVPAPPATSNDAVVTPHEQVSDATAPAPAQSAASFVGQDPASSSSTTTTTTTTTTSTTTTTTPYPTLAPTPAPWENQNPTEGLGNFKFLTLLKQM